MTLNTITHIDDDAFDIVRGVLVYRTGPKKGQPVTHTCSLCGQRIDDGKPCGCGARDNRNRCADCDSCVIHGVHS